MKANFGTTLDRDAVLGPAHRPQRFDRPVQKALPGLRTHGEPEQRAVVAPLQAIASGLLTVRPAGRQIGKARDPVIDDRIVPHRRADHLVVFRGEYIEQRLHDIARDRRSASCRDRIRHISPPAATGTQSC
jgi:hypothetical protein